MFLSNNYKLSKYNQIISSGVLEVLKETVFEGGWSFSEFVDQKGHYHGYYDYSQSNQQKHDIPAIVEKLWNWSAVPKLISGCPSGSAKDGLCWAEQQCQK